MRAHEGFGWPSSFHELERMQQELAAASAQPFVYTSGDLLVAGCFVCFTRRRTGAGYLGEPGWAGAALVRGRKSLERVAVGGIAGAEYRAGYLALREGPLLERAVKALPEVPDALIINASGRDHPRRAGLAVHLGAVLGIPTVGATRRPLEAVGHEPPAARGAATPLRLEGDVVGYWARTREGSRPIAVHAGWRTDPESALNMVLAATRRARTPEPLRQARRMARLSRAWCASDTL